MEQELYSEVFKITNLTKKYGKKLIVDNLSFSGKAGEIIGFLGPNGAGKTTTIKMMTGLSSITAGAVKICGHDIQKDFEKAVACVGAVVETPYLYEQISGMENLRIFCEAKHADAQQLEKMIALTDLGDRLKDKVKNYSLGMKQRLGIAVALMANPPLLILDEPTNGLDPLAIKDLRTFLKDLAHKESVCVFISSHMLWEMEKLCDRVIIIDNGAFIGDADIGKLSAEGSNLEDFYVACVEQRNTGDKI